METRGDLQSFRLQWKTTKKRWFEKKLVMNEIIIANPPFKVLEHS